MAISKKSFISKNGFAIVFVISDRLIKLSYLVLNVMNAPMSCTFGI